MAHQKKQTPEIVLSNLPITDFQQRILGWFSLQKLLTLPGIGNYTAGAIMSLAFNRNHAVVDANIERVFSRLFNISTPIKSKESRQFIWQAAARLLPAGQARFFNQALMELGALVCLAEKPSCRTCPVHIFCQAYRHDLMAERPVKAGKKKTVFIEMSCGVLMHRNKIFIQKRLPEGVWANLWEFPGGQLEGAETPEQALLREFDEETGFAVQPVEKIGIVKHNHTIYRVTLHGYFCRFASGTKSKPVLHAAQEYRWVPAAELADHAFSAGHRHLVNLLPPFL